MSWVDFMDYVDLKSGLRHRLSRESEVTRLWRTLAPIKVVILVISFHLIFSLAYIVVFSRAFGFGKRMAGLHLSLVSCLIVVTVLCLGSILLFRPVREWRFTRFLLPVAPAAGFSLLVLLYAADYAGNALWGNNINYELAAQYLSRRGIFQKELQLLPGKVYVVLAAGLAAIFLTYLRLSGPLFRSLEELFVPGRRLSLFRDRRRVRFSILGISLSLLLLVGVAVQTTMVASPYRDRLLLHEPLVSLFTNSEGLNAFVSYNVRATLEAEDRRVRASYPSGQSFDKKNVVIIMVDSLRADHMQVYDYDRSNTPFLAGLLKTGRLRKVELAMSTCADTSCGVAATLSSKLLEKQIPLSYNLPDLLHDQGYETYFILSGSHRWYNLKSSYATHFTYYFDGAESARFDWNDDRVIAEGLERVPDFASNPAFFYFHLMSTHSTGIKQPRYNIYQPAKNWVEFSTGEFEDQLVANHYDSGVVQADAIIEGIFGSLKKKGYLDNSIVVILSDHGEALGQRDHARYGHVNYLYQECIRIPLLIHDDAAATYSNLQYATQIDVAPTILDRLGLIIPSSWQGQSLLAPDSTQYSFHRTKTYPQSYAVIYRAGPAIYKYILHPALGEELFELVSDPQEKRNLMDIADSAMIENLRKKMNESLQGE